MNESSTGTDGKRRRQTIVVVGLVFLVALGLRLGHLAALEHSFSGTSLFTTPVVDAAYHWEEALQILDGDSQLRDRVPWKGPGYSWFLAGLAAVLGRSLGNVRWALAGLGALNCALIVLLARRLLPLGWSVAAGLLAACNGILIVYDGEPYFPTLLILLNLVVLYLLGGEKSGALAHASAGAILGLACLVHPAYLLPAALLLPWIFRRGARPALAWCLAVAAVIAPVTLANLLLREQPVLISWNGGANLYAANHPTFDPRAGNASFAWGRVLNTTVDAGIEGEAERDRAYYRLALRQAMRYPVESVAMLAKKGLIFFSPPEIASNFRIYQLREHSPVAAATLGHWGPLWIPFGLWGPAAILGLAILLRRPAPLTTAMTLWSVGVMLSCVLFFNTARYRAPVLFFGCIWAAAALRWVVGRWRAGDRRRLYEGLAIWIALVVVLASVAAPQTNLPPPLEFHEAQALQEAGAIERMEEWAGRALERDSGSPALGLFVAELYGRAGRTEAQREELNRVLALPDLEPDAADSAHEALARSFLADDDLDGARREYLAALAIGADSAEWRGYPYYRMEMGPVRACWLRLYLAEVEILDDRTDVARELIDRVLADCPHGNRYPPAIGRLERMIIDRHGLGAL
jgi:hypothetical protein